ncbi:MAG: aminopeptidase [Candidatus Sumerlaeia bacterium]|nr:aminopeptidase [Candidatus Sumerlaeia bacterium]
MYGPTDPRDLELAKVLLDHSTRPKKGEVVMIHGVGLDTLGLLSVLARETAKRGAIPFVKLDDPSLLRDVIENASEAVFKGMGEFELEAMKRTKCYIGIRGTSNAFEMAGVNRDKMRLYNEHYSKPVMLEQRVKHTRWVVLRYPNNAMAQLAQRSRETFAEFYYRVCCTDYAKMEKAVKPLKALMEKTNRVEIKGPGTDLRMSIKGIKSIPCCGTHNIPDGECFTAPVRDSVEGVVTFNAPTIYEGNPFDGIKLTFKAGKVVSAECPSADQTRKLNDILDQDPGARYVGEFAIAFHPHIHYAMRDILFDEKICGSFHMALGQCYEETENGNRSVVHWDMVNIQRPDFGGGEMYFDGKLVRKDGAFVAKGLEGLNPEAFGVAMPGTAAKKPAAEKNAKKG